MKSMITPGTWRISIHVSSAQHNTRPLPLRHEWMPQCPSELSLLSWLSPTIRAGRWGKQRCLLRHVLLREKPVWCVVSSKAAWQMWCDHVTTVKPEPLFKPIAKSHLHSHSSAHTTAKQSNLDGALEALKSAERLSMLTSLPLLCFCYLTPLFPAPTSSSWVIYYLTWMLGM